MSSWMVAALTLALSGVAHAGGPRVGGAAGFGGAVDLGSGNHVALRAALEGSVAEARRANELALRGEVAVPSGQVAGRVVCLDPLSSFCGQVQSQLVARAALVGRSGFEVGERDAIFVGIGPVAEFIRHRIPTTDGRAGDPTLAATPGVLVEMGLRRVRPDAPEIRFTLDVHASNYRFVQRVQVPGLGMVGLRFEMGGWVRPSGGDDARE